VKHLLHTVVDICPRNVNNVSGPEVLFKTCVAMKYDDDDDEQKSVLFADE